MVSIWRRGKLDCAPRADAISRFKSLHLDDVRGSAAKAWRGRTSSEQDMTWGTDTGKVRGLPRSTSTTVRGGGGAATTTAGIKRSHLSGGDEQDDPQETCVWVHLCQM